MSIEIILLVENSNFLIFYAPINLYSTVCYCSILVSKLKKLISLFVLLYAFQKLLEMENTKKKIIRKKEHLFLRE